MSSQSQASPTFSDLAIAAEQASLFDDYPSYPSEAGPSSERRSSVSTTDGGTRSRRPTKKPEGYVARPANKFMLFRSHAIRNKCVALIDSH